MKQKTNIKEKSDSITRTESFAGVIARGADGKRTLVLNSPAWYRHQMQRFKDGEKVTLEVHNRRPKRTDAQNRYYFGAILPLLAEKLGEPKIELLHELVKGLFLTEGIYDVGGRKVRLIKSTTELTKAEFSELIMNIESEFGIVAPPTENWDLPKLHDEDES